MFPRAARRRIPADYEFLLAPELYLYPRSAAASGLVGGVLALADEAFKADFSRLSQKLTLILPQGGRKAKNPRGVLEQPFKPRLSSA